MRACRNSLRTPVLSNEPDERRCSDFPGGRFYPIQHDGIGAGHDDGLLLFITWRAVGPRRTPREDMDPTVEINGYVAVFGELIFDTSLIHPSAEAENDVQRTESSGHTISRLPGAFVLPSST